MSPVLKKPKLAISYDLPESSLGGKRNPARIRNLTRTLGRKTGIQKTKH